MKSCVGSFDPTDLGLLDLGNLDTAAKRWKLPIQMVESLCAISSSLATPVESDIEVNGALFTAKNKSNLRLLTIYCFNKIKLFGGGLNGAHNVSDERLRPKETRNMRVKNVYAWLRESEASAVKTQVRGNALCKTVRLPYLASTWTKCINSLGLSIQTELTGWCIGRKDEGVKMYKELHVTGGCYELFYIVKVLFLDEGLLIPLMKTFKVRFESFFKSVDYERWMEGVVKD
ncbi:hypothetical protein Tco_0786618 [Tanacetum coccineum]